MGASSTTPPAVTTGYRVETGATDPGDWRHARARPADHHRPRVVPGGDGRVRRRGRRAQPDGRVDRPQRARLEGARRLRGLRGGRQGGRTPRDAAAGVARAVYDVRPTRRREGHATAMLQHALPWALGLGIDPALVTCDDDNVGSIRVIEAAGGVLEDVRGVKRRYWVPTAS